MTLDNQFTAYRQYRATHFRWDVTADGNVAGAMVALASDIRFGTPAARTAFLK